MNLDLKDYGTHSIAGIKFIDYWNLSEHPLYMILDKKYKKYLRFTEIPTNDYTKVDSLCSLKMFLNNNDWCYDTKKWQTIAIVIQAAINIPYIEQK